MVDACDGWWCPVCMQCIYNGRTLLPPVLLLLRLLLPGGCCCSCSLHDGAIEGNRGWNDT